jgi:DNA repair exonuclease SbcCD ATPase subunit
LKKYLAHVKESVDTSDALKRQLESKECCQQASAEIIKLKKYNKELKRYLAICPVCGFICNPGQHKKILSGLQKGGYKLDSFLESLGKGEKQVMLRVYFNNESKKNNGDFNDKTKM